MGFMDNFAACISLVLATVLATLVSAWVGLNAQTKNA